MDYYYKYCKYKSKYLELLGAGYTSKLENCNYLQFPDWVIDMSHKYSDQVVDYSKFKILKESIYSSELPFHIANWKSILEENIKNLQSTDNLVWGLNMTTNIGGFDINMVNHYKNLHITALELDKCTYNALKHNVAEFKMKNNIHPKHIDSVKYLDTINTKKKYDFVYLDPPWGGVDYIKQDQISLSLSDIDIHDIVDRVFEKKVSNLVFLKGPVNFEYNSDKYKVDQVMFLTPTKRVSYKVYIIKN